MIHPQRLTGLTLFIHCDENGKFLVCVASDKLFHCCSTSFRGSRSLCEKPLQRFHSIIIGSYPLSFGGGLKVILAIGREALASRFRFSATLAPRAFPIFV